MIEAVDGAPQEAHRHSGFVLREELVHRHRDEHEPLSSRSQPRIAGLEPEGFEVLVRGEEVARRVGREPSFERVVHPARTPERSLAVKAARAVARRRGRPRGEAAAGPARLRYAPGMARACVLLAPGFEEIEAVTLIDVLRRAEIETVVLATEALRVRGSHGIVMEADALLADRTDERWDVVLLPGGMPGAAHLRDSELVQNLLREQHARGGRLGAICAAPIALSQAGVLDGKTATSFPGFADALSCGAYSDEPVVVDGEVTTSRGPATALAFALEIVRQIRGEEVSADLAQRMLVRDQKR